MHPGPTNTRSPMCAPSSISASAATAADAAMCALSDTTALG
jgi:hypothetical protein